MDRSTQHAIKLIAAILTIAAVALVAHFIVQNTQRNAAESAQFSRCMADVRVRCP